MVSDTSFWIPHVIIVIQAIALIVGGLRLRSYGRADLSAAQCLEDLMQRSNTWGMIAVKALFTLKTIIDTPEEMSYRFDHVVQTARNSYDELTPLVPEAKLSLVDPTITTEGRDLGGEVIRYGE